MFTITVKTGMGAKSVEVTGAAAALRYLVEFQTVFGHQPTVTRAGHTYTEANLRFLQKT
jgi:hypothetical protein